MRLWRAWEPWQPKPTINDPLLESGGENDHFPPQGAIYQGVWESAAQLRRSGELLNLGRLITCPTIAIHGNFDPHPAEGVEGPLTSVLQIFKFVLLTNCGHTPWLEKQAREAFYQSLRVELAL